MDRLVAEVEALRAENGCLAAALAQGPEAWASGPILTAAGSDDGSGRDSSGGSALARLAMLEQQLRSLQAQAAALAEGKKAAEATVASLTSELVSTRSTANMVLYRLLEEMQKGNHQQQHGVSNGGSYMMSQMGHMGHMAMPYMGMCADWAPAGMMATAMHMPASMPLSGPMQLQPSMQLQHPTQVKQLQFLPPLTNGDEPSDEQQQAQQPGLGCLPALYQKQQQAVEAAPAQQQQQPAAKKARSRDEAPSIDQAAPPSKRQATDDGIGELVAAS